MKHIVIIFVILLGLGSCAHKKSESTSQMGSSASSVENEKKSREQGETRAIFHVVAPLGVELIITSLETRKEEKVLMDKTLSQLSLKPGHWQVSGFVLNGKVFKIMTSAKQFIFQLKPKKITYVGSYIFQCPKVNHQYTKDMKKMKFFNRYPFSSRQQLCELVVGSDFDNVNRVWLDLGSDKDRSLTLGF